MPDHSTLSTPPDLPFVSHVAGTVIGSTYEDGPHLRTDDGYEIWLTQLLPGAGVRVRITVEECDD